MTRPEARNHERADYLDAAPLARTESRDAVSGCAGAEKLSVVALGATLRLVDLHQAMMPYDSLSG